MAELDDKVDQLLSILTPQVEMIQEMSFRVNILWNAFKWLCGIIGVSVVGALLALVIKGG